MFVRNHALALVLSSGLVAASTRQQVALPDSTKTVDLGLQRNATINLFAKRAFNNPDEEVKGCDKDSVYSSMTLEPETCLSGDYYAFKNFQIAEQPLCPKGNFPIMVYYHQRGCDGKVVYHSKFDDVGPPSTCLFESSPRYWSVVFRCGPWATLERGAEKNVAAIQPLMPSSPSEKPVSGAVETYLGPLCNGQRERPMIVPVDKCLSTHGYSVRIMTPAVCANGTRALWARFEGNKCNYGEITYEDGLLDIQDDDIGTCQATGQVGSRRGKVGSMSFWCEGFGDVERPDPNAPPVEEKPKPASGSVSETACGYTAPFFNHPKTDTCVNLRTDKIKIYSSGVCENGTSALWAKYKEKNCVGSPASILNVREDMMKTCLDVADTSSFSFWCTGEGLGKAPEASPSKPKTPKRSGMPAFLIIVLSLMGVLLFGLAVFMAYAFRDQLHVSLPTRFLPSQDANSSKAMFRRDGYGSIAL